MTLVRRLAVRISRQAVEAARPRCRDWAEGLAREVEFVEGDWRALGWALGSWKVLLRNPPPPLGTPAEIARAGRIHAGDREHVPPVVALLMAIQAFNFGQRAIAPVGHLGDLQRVAYAIAALCAAYLAVVTWMQTRMGPRPEDMEDSAWIAFYRSEMVRLRDLYSNFGALFGVAIVLFFAGTVVGLNGVRLPFLTAGMLIAFAPLAAIVRVNPGPVERYQQKIDEVDRVLQRGGVQG